MFKKINQVTSWFTNMGTSIDEHDDRGVVKVGVVPEELTEDERGRRLRNMNETFKAREYLVMRKKEMLTCPDFMPTPSNATDIRVTMRNYIDEMLPASKDLYKFLYA